MTTIRAGQVAVVTGAAAGIGFALAEAFAQRGLRVALADRDEGALESAARRIKGLGVQVLAVPTDVADRRAVQALRDQTLAAFGSINILCNNAGVFHDVGPVWAIDIARWRQMVEINFWGVVHGIQEFVPHFIAQGAGHVVNTASMSGLSTAPGIADYGTTKHAVVALTELLRADLDLAGATGVKTTALCPSLVKTGAAERVITLLSASQSDAQSKKIGSGPDMFTMLQASEFAEAALRGIEADWLYVLPTPGSHERFFKRIDPIAAAFELQDPKASTSRP